MAPKQTSFNMKQISRRDMLTITVCFGTTIASGVALQGTARSAELPARAGKKSKIVVTGGHPGDPEYGCGGTIARNTYLGHQGCLLYLYKGDPRGNPGETASANRGDTRLKADI